MNIFEELYYGNISEVDRRKTIIKNKKEELLYDKLKEKLGNEDNMLDEFIEILFDNESLKLKDSYIQGVKTGILLGISAGDIEF